MFEMNLKLADDRQTAQITLPNSSGPIEVTAAELGEMIMHLAWFRAEMLPAHEPVDLTPETRVSIVPAIRWQPTEDEIPGQCRLFLLHPGFGWIYIPLDQKAFDKLSEGCRMFLQAPRATQ